MKLKTMLFAILSVVIGANFTSCSSSNDNGNDDIVVNESLVKPGNVFPGTRLRNFCGADLIYDAHGLWIEYSIGASSYKLTYNKETVTFEGTSVFEGEENHYSYTLIIDANGFVTNMKGIRNAQQDDCDYTYSTEGYLTKIVCRTSTAPGYEPTSGDTFTQCTLLKWQDGKLISTAASSYEITSFDDSEARVITFEYGDAPVENKGMVMTFDDIFDGNAYGVSTFVPYYGGMMGKGMRYLPIRANHTKYNTYDIYEWTFDANGYVTAWVIRRSDDNQVVDDYTFGW
ncbi:MAG: DUF4595 domain-containing protein [Mediterranea sp.]|jgi:hypothetical protein|nr:DUF4595 domain-containing protein [Mediterranea sp.]